MIPLFSTKQIREADNYAADKLLLPGIVLMENAALSIYNAVINNYSAKNPLNKIGIISGKGNNGGDGFAAARHFANNNFEVIVIHIVDEAELSGDALINFKIIKQIASENKSVTIKKYSPKSLKMFNNCDAIIDAMLGSGVEGDLREPYKKIVEKINEINSYKIAVDIPTGLSADKGSGEVIYQSNLTITLGDYKKGLFIEKGHENCGEIIRGDIGIGFSFFDRFEIDDYLIEPEDALRFVPAKNKSSHKYSAGKVLTIAGSANYPGAAALSSASSLYAGAGASILAFPISAKKLIHKKITEVVVDSYDDKKKGFLFENNIDELKEKIKWANVIAVGPGLGREESTGQAVKLLLKKRKEKIIVLDADGLYALKDGEYKNHNLKNCVLTPHHGEFSTMLGISTNELKKDILFYGKSFASAAGCFLVLKGAPTVIFNPSGEAFINTAGNAGMAKFGTGDVLTGLIAGFISQTKNIEQSIISAVYLHSLTADILAKKKTELGYVATDIMKNFSAAIKFLRKSID